MSGRSVSPGLATSSLTLSARASGSNCGVVSLRLAYPDFPWPPEEEHIEATLDMIFNGCKGVGAVLAPAGANADAGAWRNW